MTAANLTAVELLDYLRSRDIQIFVEGDRLRCNAPEGVLTPELRAELTNRKSELIALLHGANQAINSLAPSSSRSHQQPLSFAQQRLWFLDQLVPHNPFYNMPAALHLQGRVNVTALEQAFRTIVQRHEALRTTFVEVNGQPLQAIAPTLNLSLPVVDLQHATDREAVSQQLATEEAHRPFNLTMGPLLRVKLLKRDETDYILLLTLHHIVSDGWSLGVLIRELGVLYPAFVNDQPAPLSELPIQYADFAAWQRHSLQDVFDTQLAYWRHQLQELPLLELPTDRPRPPVQGYRGATHPLTLSPPLTAALEALSQAEGVTLFMTLLAAFQVLLYHYTGQSDIAVGSPIANRNRSEIEGLIGFFVNSLVLRTDLSGNPTVRELLGRVREVALAAYAHQDLPFEKLVEDLHPQRDLSRNPLFQVVFALQNTPVNSLELPGLTLTPWPLAIGTTRFDLEVHLWERSQGLSGLWEQPIEGISGFVAYNTDLFEPATIARLVNQFQTLLAGIIAHPDRRLADLSILSAAERHQMLVEWNDTGLDYPRDRCLHQWFADQVTQTPDTVAVVFRDQQLTYRELDQRSNQLAHYLQSLGVQPEVLVGICLERSLEMMVAVLAVWKAGGAYVPLDPEYPSDRLRWMLSDAQVSILVTQQSLVEKLPQVQRVICLDDDWQIIAEQSQNAPTSSVTADNLAYVIYTSGSTGTPKGVMLEHRGLGNVITAQIQTFQLQPGDRVLQFSSLSFDASLFEMLLAFGVGGTLYIAPSDVRSSGTRLSQFLRDHAIAATILPPAVLATLPDQLPNLHTVIAGGEACSAEIVDRWAVDRWSNGRRFFNAYGPTEATIWATVAHLQPGDKPTIGRPIANTQIYLLNAHLQPVAIGVVGEIYISGDGLARGYLDRPDLTAERFVGGKRREARGKGQEAGGRQKAGGRRQEAEGRRQEDEGFLTPDTQALNSIIRPLNSTIQAPFAERCLQYSELQPQNSELQPLNSELQPQNSELQPLNSELQPQNSELQPQNSELQPLNSELQPQNSNPSSPRPSPLAPRPSPFPFAPSPSPFPLLRLYKTGDLARYRPDGMLEFLGRRDDQVKLRGFRVELGEIEAVLTQQPIIREAIVTAQDHQGDKRLIAYLTLNLREGDQGLLLEQLQTDQIEHWQTLYNQTYAQADPADHPDTDPTFNIVGWNSSYTGQPIAADQMREWLHYRVEQILALKPRRVLEIGCGTGLLLFAIAPHCTDYWATDFSSASLDVIQQPAQAFPQVRLLHQQANDFTHLTPSSFDVVILNSVVQYFPSVDYLLQVLAGAMQVVAPGGLIFVGDVRSLPLLSAFHAAVHLHQAEAALERSHLHQRVQQSRFEEPELVIDPQFFNALRSEFPQISRVEMHLTRGRALNEMTQFRYNVVLQVDALTPKLGRGEVGQRLMWDDRLTPEAVYRQLIETQPEILEITGVPNARVMAAVKTVAWLTGENGSIKDGSIKDGLKTVGQLRQELETLSELGIDPEEWWGLAARLPYQIGVHWSDCGDDRYDVSFVRSDSLHSNGILPGKSIAPQLWSTYTNQPLQAQLARRMIPQLRTNLEQKLPSYMLPSAFVILEALPLTPNGKVDRRALPAPDRLWVSSHPAGPRSPTEITLVQLWANLLGLKQVSIHDHFFELGGHSLLATQLTSRIRDAFGVELPLRSVFAAPTIAQLAPIIEDLQVQAKPVAPAIVPLVREAHRRLRSSLPNP